MNQHNSFPFFKGGFFSGKATNNLHSFLPRLRRWVINHNMTFARCDHGMATIGDKIFCLGGRKLNDGEEWIHVSETEYYCPTSDQWTILKSFPLDCSQFSICAKQSKILITGGGSLRQMKKEDSVFVYDPEARTWIRAGSLPHPLVDHASCSVKLSHLVLFKIEGQGTAAITEQ